MPCSLCSLLIHAGKIGESAVAQSIPQVSFPADSLID